MSEQISAESFDSHLEAISNPERRRLLLALLEATRDSATPIDAGAIESDGDERPLDIQLVHVHLPKLESLGYVASRREHGSDQGRHLVSEGPRFDGIRPLLELLEDNEAVLPDDLR
jgi:DNA-binding transcriptional ArsR family regulator